MSSFDTQGNGDSEQRGKLLKVTVNNKAEFAAQPPALPHGAVLLLQFIHKATESVAESGTLWIEVQNGLREPKGRSWF